MRISRPYAIVAAARAAFLHIDRGKTNAGGPSRFVVAFEVGKCVLCEECLDVCPMSNISIEDGSLKIEFDHCIGCGQCVSHCPDGALYMELRKKQPKIHADNNALFRRLNIEALVGLAVNKITGR